MVNCILQKSETKRVLACPGFLKGGGPISLGSLKKGHQILKGGVQWSDGGGSSTLVSLGRQIFAYLDAKK